MDDLISRQAAMDAINSMFAPTPTQKDMVMDCLEIIDNLPPAERRGRWTYKEDRRIVDGYDWQCSQCNSWQRYTSNYCPNCGALMVNEND